MCALLCTVPVHLALGSGSWERLFALLPLKAIATYLPLQSLCCLSIMPQRKRHKLQTPVVSPEEEAEAKKCLENTNNQKKTHSSMTWYLKSVHAKPEYDGWSIGAQREYFIAPTAEHLKTRGAKVQRSWRSVETAKQKEKQYVWMSF